MSYDPTANLEKRSAKQKADLARDRAAAERGMKPQKIGFGLFAGWLISLAIGVVVFGAIVGTTVIFFAPTWAQAIIQLLGG